MVNCPKCNRDVGELVSFCENCGTSLVYKCDECGTWYYYASSNFDKLGNPKCPNCFKNELPLSIIKIDKKIEDIQSMINKIEDLRDLSVRLDGNDESPIVKKQQSILQYLYTYKLKFNISRFSQFFEYKLNQFFMTYKETNDLNSFYTCIMNVLEEDSSAIIENKKVNGAEDVYNELNLGIQKIKDIIRNEIALQTTKILTSISPLNNDSNILSKIEETKLSDYDTETLNIEYDRFIAEISLL